VLERDATAGRERGDEVAPAHPKVSRLQGLVREFSARGGERSRTRVCSGLSVQLASVLDALCPIYYSLYLYLYT